MSSESPAVAVRGLGKSYRIAHLEGRSDTLVSAAGRALGRRLKGRSVETFWALRDVSFEVERGGVMGIIGRNGAGKSTLLKILSRITAPTEGDVELRGRVGSLLEVGTGFHPELTGRENIFLNGTILGMRRAEIAARFDEIVAFAEVDRFLDTPVKRYSSGMYVRLAFGVAAHLNPEILIVDEVLAVGDIAFQKKCLGKMGEVATQRGTTVLFVSHNMGAISALTKTAILMDGGRVIEAGDTASVVARYLADMQGMAGRWKARGRTAHPAQILEVGLFAKGGEAGDVFSADDGFTVEILYEIREPVTQVRVEFFVFGPDGTHLVTSGDFDRDPSPLEMRRPGLYRARIAMPGNLLNTGSYVLRVNCGTAETTFDHEETNAFQIVEPGGISGRLNRRGHIMPMIPWETVRQGEAGSWGESA